MQKNVERKKFLILNLSENNTHTHTRTHARTHARTRAVITINLRATFRTKDTGKFEPNVIC